MNKDHFAGGYRHLKGRAQTAAGSVTGDLGRQAEGAVNQIAGGARFVYGDARDAYQDVRDATASVYDSAGDRARSTAERGLHLAEEAVRRGRAIRDRTSGTADHYRTIGLLVAAGVGFALASNLVRRTS